MRMVLGSAELPSVGSAGHHIRQCKPCAFVGTAGCANGRAALCYVRAHVDTCSLGLGIVIQGANSTWTVWWTPIHLIEPTHTMQHGGYNGVIVGEASHPGPKKRQAVIKRRLMQALGKATSPAGDPTQPPQLGGLGGYLAPPRTNRLWMR